MVIRSSVLGLLKIYIAVANAMAGYKIKQGAMEVFGGLYGWGTCVDISPEEYYDMAFDRLLEQKPSVKRCPHCGLLIE